LNPIPCVPFPLRKGAKGFDEGEGDNFRRGVCTPLRRPGWGRKGEKRECPRGVLAPLSKKIPLSCEERGTQGVR
jgi:hypothetical protein